MSDGDVKCLYDMPVIDGKKIMVFECGRPPVNEYGGADVVAFAADSSPNRNVYYEASDMTVEWFKSPFYVGRTPPTHEELAFQLRKWHSERQTKFIIAGAVGIFILYLLFK